MGTTILGLSAYYHDSAAALLVDGEVIAAAQEERFTRVKHDARFPAHAVQYCLREAGIDPEELDYIAFYDKPLLKFDRLIETYLSFAPAGLNSFLSAMPVWLKTKLHLPREIRKSLPGGQDKPLVFLNHHESHAASAFFPSPFADAAILTLDGVGEWETTTIGLGNGNKLQILKTLQFPHSIGLLYSAFTYFIGFRVNSGEYKLMGLAPYGEPKYASLILEKLIDLKEDGSFAMDMRYFHFCQGLRMTSPAFDKLFGGPARKPEAFLTQREMDLAASIQVVTEEIILRIGRTCKSLTGARNLCMAGGVALNCVANGRLLRSGLFDDIWIQPAAGDAGGALGSALFVHHQLLENPRSAGSDIQKGSLLGPSYTDAEVRRFLDSNEIPYRHFDLESELNECIAGAIAEGKVVGWFCGRMEFGPRALGARSIMGDARNATMQSTMNLRIKYRESFRPFAPAVLLEDVQEYFDLDRASPYMLLVAPVREDKRCALTDQQQRASQTDPDLRKRLQVKRSLIPAVTHVDGSARIQTVDEARHGRFYRLIKEFKRQTSCSLIINTSFNIRGEPIVCTPEDAYRCFRATEMDILVLENSVLFRTGQPARDPSEKQKYIDSFQLD